MRGFDRSLPMSLLKAREAVMKKFIPHLRAHELSAQQWRVLRALSDHTEGLDMSALAARCYLLMPSLSRIVQNLEGRELVKRRVSSQDQRCSIISLANKGQELVELMAPESEARYQYITEVFGYGKLELLYELLDELVTKLETAEHEQVSDSSLREE